MTQEELNKIIENHRHWLRQDCEGWEDMCADLTGANLVGANLTGANLVGVNLRWANLTGANLAGVNLRWANLRGANLRGANLRDADLRGADLRDADLTDADLREAFNIPFIPMACPTEGSFIGWKKAHVKTNKVIVKLLIPEDARRSSATSRKCRCDKAKVLSITSLDGKVQYQEAYSQFNCSFAYKVGKEVAVSDFYEDRFKECAAGIHFFISREEAVRY